MGKIVNFENALREEMRVSGELEKLEVEYIHEAEMIEQALLSTPEAQAVTVTDEQRDAAYERLMQRVHKAANL